MAKELSMIAGSNEAQLLAQYGVNAHVVLMNWDNAWRDILNIALYRHGADVSEIGAPWVGGIEAMNALRPFTRQEVAEFGGGEAFLPASWQATRLHNESEIWSIPWLVDTTVIYYWRDLLDETGIDEKNAFQTPEKLAETLRLLQENGHAFPWAVDPLLHWGTLHHLASWIWHNGGDILDPDTKKPMFFEPEAMRGIKAYFALHPYIAPELRQSKEPIYSIDLFSQRKAAVGIGAPDWLVHEHSALKRRPELKEKVGIALPPGPPYVGGSNLAVWKHIRNAREGVELIRRMVTNNDLQRAYSQQLGFLPARLEVLEEAPFTADPHLQVMVQALRTGRTYPTMRRWGLVEERLSAIFIQIWKQIFDDPYADSDVILERYLGPLSKRLEMTLKEFGG